MSRVTVASVALCLAGLFAQEFRGTLTGRVMDQQGAAIPGVRIIATQVETGSKSETISSSVGQYTLPFLPPGAYSVSAEATGFKRYALERIQVPTGERVALDITLEIGQLTETVTVTAEASLIETTTASSGQVISSRQIENMPLNGRTPLVLAQLSFGVIPTSDPRFYRPFDNAGPSDFSMGGAPARTNELLVDGSPDATGNNRVAFNPPVDSVEEVRVHTFEADAAYGHTGGGTVNVVLKGGSNTLHGAAYNFNQVSALAATPFFTNRAGQRKSVTRYNQYGINSGGPLVIPKLFDGRNKVFFYFAFEGIKDSFAEPRTETVPTEAMRRGDFSALLRVNASYQIYDPATSVIEGSRVRRQPFPDNIIPANRISPIARAYLQQFYPLPNQPGRVDGQDNFLAASVRSDNFDSEMGRLDFNLSERHKFFWNFRHNDRVENRGNIFDNIATGNFLGRINWGSTFDDVYTFNPTTVLNIRLNWTRFIESGVRPSDGFDFTTLGFPQYIKAASSKNVLPRIDLDRFTDVGDSGGDRTPYDSFQIFSNLTKVAGSHSVKMGADLRLLRESSLNFGNASGSYTFRQDWTRGPLDNSPVSPLGQDLASFLLGLPTGGSFDVNTGRTAQAGYYALFLHDDWRVRQNLTLNIGLRYERDLPTSERFSRSVNGFDFNVRSPISDAALAAYARNSISQVPVSQFRTLGGLQFAGADGKVYETRANYFSPRLGFAWTPKRLGGDTAIRGGAGVFIFPIGVTGVNQTGFSQSTLVVRTLDQVTPRSTLANPFPGGIEQPTGSSLGPATFLGRDVEFTNPRPLNAYSVRWNSSIQHQLPGNMVIEAGYIGNHAVHLLVDRTQLNFVPASYLSTSPLRDQATIDFLTALVPNPFAGLLPGTSLNAATVSRQQLLRPHPQFGNIAVRGASNGSSYFHMMDVRLEKRYSHGLSLLANYALSKLIEKRTRLNESDPSLEKRIAGEDRPQRVVISANYDLPFGRGKAFGSTANGVVHRFIGGWVINGIYTWQPGPPVDWGNLIYYGGDLRWDPRNIDRAFDITRFERSANLQLASNIRRFPSRFATLRGDGANNFDFSVIKNTTITERVNLQFRAEFFNALNHPSFSAPERSATSSNFGRITGQSNLPRSTQLALRMTW